MATRATTVRRLKVMPWQVKPPVWPRIEVPANVKLSDLSGVLGAATGRRGGHLTRRRWQLT